MHISTCKDRERGGGEVGNENVTGFKAILRISVAKLVITFSQNDLIMSYCLEICVIFLWSMEGSGGGEWLDANCIKKNKIASVRSRDNDLYIIYCSG